MPDEDHAGPKNANRNAGVMFGRVPLPSGLAARAPTREHDHDAEDRQQGEQGVRQQVVELLAEVVEVEPASPTTAGRGSSAG